MTGEVAPAWLEEAAKLGFDPRDLKEGAMRDGDVTWEMATLGGIRQRYRRLQMDPARVFQELDADQSGVIDEPEFIQGTRRLYSESELAGVSDEDLWILFTGEQTLPVTPCEIHTACI